MTEKKKRLSSKNEKFCTLVAGGDSLTDAFKKVNPHAENWLLKSVCNSASRLARREDVAERLKELEMKTEKEFIKEFVVEKSHTAKVMAKITIDPEAKDSDKIAACKALNDMYGYNSPSKSNVDHTSSDGSMAPSRGDVSLAILEEIKKRHEPKHKADN